jgi:hypothetical protein
VSESVFVYKTNKKYTNNTTFRPTCRRTGHLDPQHIDTNNTTFRTSCRRPGHLDPQHIDNNNTTFRTSCRRPEHLDPQHIDTNSTTFRPTCRRFQLDTSRQRRHILSQPICVAAAVVRRGMEDKAKKGEGVFVCNNKACQVIVHVSVVTSSLNLPPLS